MIPGLLSRQLVVVLASRYDACEEDQLVYRERGAGATVKVGLRRTQNPKKSQWALEEWTRVVCIGTLQGTVTVWANEEGYGGLAGRHILGWMQM